MRETTPLSLAHKFDVCIKLETVLGGLYSELSKIFPEAKDLFEKLASEEAVHAKILTIGERLENIDELSEDFFIKLSNMIIEPIIYIRILKSKIEQKELSLKEALELSLKIEQSGAEAYFQATMLNEAVGSVILFLKQFYTANTNHANMISEFHSQINKI
jgi:rubrerythrin